MPGRCHLGDTAMALCPKSPPCWMVAAQTKQHHHWHTSSPSHTIPATTPATKGKKKAASTKALLSPQIKVCSPTHCCPSALQPHYPHSHPGRLQGRDDLRSSITRRYIGLPQHRKSTLIPRMLPSMAPRHGTHTYTHTDLQVMHGDGVLAVIQTLAMVRAAALSFKQKQ